MRVFMSNSEEESREKLSWTEYRRSELIAFLLIALGVILFLRGTSTRNNLLLIVAVILWVCDGWVRLRCTRKLEETRTMIKEETIDKSIRAKKHVPFLYLRKISPFLYYPLVLAVDSRAFILTAVLFVFVFVLAVSLGIM